eukprot:TRINITY_DN2275_c0_g1_i1.p1 TRINITY_DN2275_c0_g1~~TRINITY_DN2275_c0_g1_i1.p1  ORF type:complete len:218 (-),score=53.19 TRINITY_DN2275_c0_g1_i1:210-863(-)
MAGSCDTVRMRSKEDLYAAIGSPPGLAAPPMSMSAHMMQAPLYCHGELYMPSSDSAPLSPMKVALPARMERMPNVETKLENDGVRFDWPSSDRVGKSPAGTAVSEQLFFHDVGSPPAGSAIEKLFLPDISCDGVDDMCVSVGSLGHPHCCSLPCKFARAGRCKDGDKCNRCHLCKWTKGKEKAKRAYLLALGREIPEDDMPPVADEAADCEADLVEM